MRGIFSKKYLFHQFLSGTTWWLFEWSKTRYNGNWSFGTSPSRFRL